VNAEDYSPGDGILRSRIIDKEAEFFTRMDELAPPLNSIKSIEFNAISKSFRSFVIVL
jgi:hydrogenase maturation factor HypF (carbamoyltransferase family)